MRSNANSMTTIKTDLYLGDCLEVLTKFNDDSFDLIMTSPPYGRPTLKNVWWNQSPMNMSTGLCLVLKSF